VGNNVNVIGKVGKNVSFFGDTVRIDAKGSVDGSAMMFGSDMNIEGQLGRDLLFMGDRVTVIGKVGGSIDEKGASLEIGSGAQVDGAVRFEGEHEAVVSSGAKLASPVQFTQHVHKREDIGHTSVFWTAVLAIAFALYGMVLFLVTPSFARESVHSAENIGASLGLGLLVFCGVFIGALIAMATMVGLFVGFSTLFVWLIAVYAAQPIVGTLLGQWILGRSNETWPLIGRMMIGILIIRTATLLPHGWILKLGVTFWGLGAIALALYRRFQPAVAALPPYVPPSAPLTPLTPAGGAAAV
jgi:hypothetical protein